MLLAASKKDVRYFIQFDIFPGGGDDVSNVDGDGMYAGARAELRNIECPRIQIPVGMNHADALTRCIDKLRDWAARAPELFNVEIEPGPMILRRCHSDESAPHQNQPGNACKNVRGSGRTTQFSAAAAIFADMAPRTLMRPRAGFLFMDGTSMNHPEFEARARKAGDWVLWCFNCARWAGR
ncbi:MAG: hypothetical protein R3E52_10160 [Burkholderiaceae bacterium]